MNIEQARTNMIKQQLRAWQVLEPRVIELLSTTPREQFVPKGYENLAFADTSIPLGEGRSMMSPKEEGRMLQELSVQPTDKVLLIDANGGYLTALLSQMAEHVWVAEKNTTFRENLELKIKESRFKNVTIVDADINGGWEKQAPFDEIVLSGSVPSAPEKLLDNLSSGGRLYAVVGKEPVMSATIYRKGEGDQIDTDKLFETLRPRVSHVKEADAFSF